MNHRNSLALLNVAQTAYSHADQLIEAAQRQTTAGLACRPGCNWCCYSQVEVTVPEAMAVLDHIRAQLDEKEIHSLAERIAEIDRRTRGMDKVTRAFSRIPCPLLGDNGCRVYEERPIVCRGWNSLDATSCETAFLGKIPESAIPINELQYTSVKKFSRHLAREITGPSEAGELLDLTTVLSKSLASPDVFDRWAAGEPVFVEAVIS